MALRNFNSEEDLYKDMGKPSKSSFFKVFCTTCVTFVEKIILFLKYLIGKVRHDEELMWDDGSEMSIHNEEGAKLRFMNTVFIVYGIFAGFVAQNYCDFTVRLFTTWSAGKSLMSDNITSTPVTILASTLIVFGVYLAVVVIQTVLYWIFKSCVVKDLYDGTQDLQVAFSYGLLAVILTSLVCLLIPSNIFMWFV